MTRVLRPGAAVCIAMVLASLNADRAAAAIVLRIQNASADSGGVVGFVASDAIPAPEPPKVDLDLDSDGGHFKFGVDLSDIQWEERCQCFRSYSIYVKDLTTSEKVRFNVRGVPSGVVRDQWQEVRFAIESNGRSDNARMTLPIGGGVLDGIRQVDAEALQESYLSGPSKVHISVQNGFKNLAIVMGTPSVTDYDERLWKGLPSFADLDGATIGATQLHEIEVQVTPRPLEALQRTLSHLKPEQAHATLVTHLRYTSPLLKNRDGRLEAKVRLRFKPAIWLLVIALATGGILGSLVRLSYAGRKTWLADTRVALLASACLWVVGLFLVGLGSEFVLFSFNFDPWQLLPTSMIGLACGLLGRESVDALKRALKLGG